MAAKWVSHLGPSWLIDYFHALFLIGLKICSPFGLHPGHCLEIFCIRLVICYQRECPALKVAPKVG